MFLNISHYEINLLFALICSTDNTSAPKTKIKNMLQSLFINRLFMAPHESHTNK